MVKRQLQWALTIFVGIIVIIGGGSLFVRHVVWPQIQRLPFVANREVVPFHEHHGLDPEIPIMIFGDAMLQTSDAPAPFIEDEVIYLPVAFLTHHYDPFLFWDDYAGVLTITTHNEMLVFNPGQTRFYVNGFPHFLDNPVLQVGDDIFMPACLAEGLYPILVRYSDYYNIVVINDMHRWYRRGGLPSRTNIRYQPDNRSPIATRAPSGTGIVIFDESENGSFFRVRTEDGILGWVPASALPQYSFEYSYYDSAFEGEPLLDDFINTAARRPTIWPEGQHVVLAWDDISEPAANYSRMEIPLYDSINVIAPTWFRLDDIAAGVTSIGSLEYVAWAQDEGIQVWPTFEVSFGQTHAFLTNRAARQRVINQLVSFVDELGLDGINIDFAPASPVEGPYFIQFLRELSLRLGMRRVVLSVNEAAQEAAFHRRELLVYTVDFVILMAQDEYGQDGDYSGPVASLPFIQNNVDNLLGYIPHDRLVLGLPFYNRIWREIIGDNTPETRQVRHFGTAYTREWFEYNNAAWEWLPEIGSYYGRFAAQEGDEIVYYRVWLECSRSVSEKLQLIQAHNLAGAAVWNRNFRHNEELWEAIGQHLR